MKSSWICSTHRDEAELKGVKMRLGRMTVVRETPWGRWCQARALVASSKVLGRSAAQNTEVQELTFLLPTHPSNHVREVSLEVRGLRPSGEHQTPPKATLP